MIHAQVASTPSTPRATPPLRWIPVVKGQLQLKGVLLIQIPKLKKEDENNIKYYINEKESLTESDYKENMTKFTSGIYDL